MNLFRSRFPLGPSHVGILLFCTAVITKISGILRYSLGPDELMVWSISRARTLSEILYRNSFEVHPPLEPFIKSLLFTVTENVDYIRCIYAAFGITAAFLIARSIPETENRKGFTIVFLLLALSQTFTHISILIRGYVFLVFFLALAIYLMKRVCCAPVPLSIRDLLCITIALTFAGLSHVSGFIAGPPILVTSILLSRASSLRNKIIQVVCSLGWLAGVGATIYLYQFRQGTGASYWRELARGPLFKNCSNFYDTDVTLIRVLDIFSPLPSSLQSPLILILSGIAGLTLYLVGLRYSYKNAKWLSLYSLGTIFLATISHVLGLYPLSSPRHMVFVLPAVLLPISHFLACVPLSKKQLQSCTVGFTTLACIVGALNLHFLHHPDFATSKKHLAQIKEQLTEVTQRNTALLSSRFALLYILKELDNLDTFYMSSGVERIKSGNASVHTCVEPMLWQTTRSSIQKCISMDDAGEMSNTTVWLTSIGFTDNRLTDIRRSALKQGNLISDRSLPGLLLFEISIQSLRNTLEGRSTGHVEDENHCTGPIVSNKHPY